MSTTPEPPTCTPRFLPPHQQERAAAVAALTNPVNLPLAVAMAALGGGEAVRPAPEHLAVLVSRYWGSGGVHLTVGFLEETAADLRDRILLHANAWGEFANVRFDWTTSLGSAQVRVTRDGDGYWSYLGTDILSIPAGQPTLCLEGFTMRTPESEYRPVVRHEFGHTLGFPHEHMRREVVAGIDRGKALRYFKATQGWNAQTVLQQVLTPLEEHSLLGTTRADVTSIMAYALPRSIMKGRPPVPGGADFSADDRAFAARIYPVPTGGAPPPPVTMALAE
jgi:hypothetical protein